MKTTQQAVWNSLFRRFLTYPKRHTSHHENRRPAKGFPMNRTMMSAVILATLLASPPVQAAVKLSRVFGHHMVIQQDQPIRLFGSADPGEKVTARFLGKTASVTANADGIFRVELPAMKADGQPHTLTVQGTNPMPVTACGTSS